MLRLVEPLQLRLFSTSSNLCTYGHSLSYGTTTNFHFPQQFWWQFQFSTGGRCNYLLSLTLTITRFREVAGGERLTTVGWRSGSQRFWNLDYSMFHYYLTLVFYNYNCDFSQIRGALYNFHFSILDNGCTLRSWAGCGAHGCEGGARRTLRRFVLCCLSPVLSTWRSDKTIGFMLWYWGSPR